MPTVIDHDPVAHATPPAAPPSPAAAPLNPPKQKPDLDELNERLLNMPREVGWLMVSIGVMGVALPGIVGTPALLAGGLMLWPKGFRTVNSWVRKRFPKTHEHGVEQMIRYLDDMERRYPTQP